MTKVTHLTLDESGGLNRRRIHLREVSGEAETPLDTIGQRLRAARLQRGDELAAVSATLKIRKEHLEAIEEDRLEDLPGRAYAVGFVRSYADYLGLEALQCVERFKAEIAGRGEAPAPIGIIDTRDERQLPHGWIAIALVLLVIVGYGAYQLARSGDILLKQPVAAVPARIAPVPATTRHPPSSVAGQPAAVSRPIPSPATAASLAQSPEPSAPLPLPAIRPAVKPPPPVTGEVSNPAANPAVPDSALAALPAGQVFGIQNKTARVILHAKQETHILVKGTDGVIFINRFLHPGDSYRVPDRVGLSLTTLDGGAVSVELDGQIMGVAGSAGEATEDLSLDPQAIVDHYNGGAPG